MTKELIKPSIEKEEVMNIKETAEWMKPIIQYLEHDTYLKTNSKLGN